jgi:hypothetical protein
MGISKLAQREQKMKHKIIYTDDYALIVSDEQIKDVRPHKEKFHLEKGYIINQFPTYLTDLSECKLIIAHRPLTDAPIFIGLPLLPSFSCGQQDDVKKLSLEMGLEYYVGGNYDFENGVRKGYNKAKETYQYTEKDLETAMLKISEYILGCIENKQVPNSGEKVDQIIKSLQQPIRPNYFTIKTTNMNLDEIREQGKGFLHANTDKPVIITNSQGQRELVGNYEGGEQ